MSVWLLENISELKRKLQQDFPTVLEPGNAILKKERKKEKK